MVIEQALKYFKSEKAKHSKPFEPLYDVAISSLQEQLRTENELQENENFIQNKFGYCFYILDSCPVIYNLYVYPQYRRCGHSKILLQFVINEIRKTGYTGGIGIQAKPRENSISQNDLIKYYESIGLKLWE